jgi:nitrile hydratase subunit beta
MWSHAIGIRRKETYKAGAVCDENRMHGSDGGDRETGRKIPRSVPTRYENWLVGLEKLLVETGLVTAEELATGKATGSTDEVTRQRVLKAEHVATVLAKGTPVTMASDTAPRFQPGDRVRAINRHPLGHTREPRYVRGHIGVIHAYHGAHVFPDRNAAGSKEGQHLYSVRFEASALWGENASAGSAVYVDLWEDYLESVC